MAAPYDSYDPSDFDFSDEGVRRFLTRTPPDYDPDDFDFSDEGVARFLARQAQDSDLDDTSEGPPAVQPQPDDSDTDTTVTALPPPPQRAARPRPRMAPLADPETLNQKYMFETSKAVGDRNGATQYGQMLQRKGWTFSADQYGNPYVLPPASHPFAKQLATYGVRSSPEMQRMQAQAQLRYQKNAIKLGLEPELQAGSPDQRQAASTGQADFRQMSRLSHAAQDQRYADSAQTPDVDPAIMARLAQMQRAGKLPAASTSRNSQQPVSVITGKPVAPGEPMPGVPLQRDPNFVDRATASFLEQTGVTPMLTDPVGFLKENTPVGQAVQSIQALRLGDLVGGSKHAFYAVVPGSKLIADTAASQWDELKGGYKQWKDEGAPINTLTGMPMLSPKSARKILAGFVPVFGPQAEHGLTQLEQGDYAGATGTAAAMLVGIFGAKALRARLPVEELEINAVGAVPEGGAGRAYEAPMPSPATGPADSGDPIGPYSEDKSSADIAQKSGNETANRQQFTSPQIKDTIAGQAGSSNESTAQSATSGVEASQSVAGAEGASGKRHVREILEDVASGKNYTERVPGRHHLGPRSLGNRLPYGDDALTLLSGRNHTILQGELEAHLRTVTKTTPEGEVVDMLPRRGNSGADVRRNFTPRERIDALDAFYRKFADGRYYAAFRMELNAALKRGGLK